MRKGESESVIEVFKNQLNANLVYVDAMDRFLENWKVWLIRNRNGKLSAQNSSASLKKRPEN